MEYSYIQTQVNLGICFIMNCPSCLLLTQKRVAAKPSGEEGNSEDSERLQAAREKRQASRNRLREMKAAAKRAREASEAVVTELPSPKKTKGKDMCENLARD